jgi:high mobility group protein B1
MEKRPELQASHPNLKLPDISKKIGTQWKALSDAEKKPYEEKAAKQKAAYESANPKGRKSKKPAPKGKSKKAGSSENESDD